MLSESGFLICPNCRGEYLHHGDVVVRVRDAEDLSGVAVTVADGEARTERTDSFIGRRDDIEIRFSCETCPATPVLRIVQHKGQTLVYWAE